LEAPTRDSAISAGIGPLCRSVSRRSPKRRTVRSVSASIATSFGRDGRPAPREVDRGCRPADAGATRGPGLLDDLLGARDRSAFTSSQSNAQRSEKSHVRETIGAQSKRPDRLEIPCSIHLSYGRERVFCVSGGLLLDDLLGARPENTSLPTLSSALWRKRVEEIGQRCA